jgi:hypothetical protein
MEVPGINGMIISNGSYMNKINRVCRYGLDATVSEWSRVSGCCVHGNEHLPHLCLENTGNFLTSQQTQKFSINFLLMKLVSFKYAYKDDKTITS